MPTDKKNSPKPPPGPTDYEVGYRKPPKASRFATGQSGNPKGRPKGARNKSRGLNEPGLRAIILAEAYRTIKVNEGKRQISIPMATAVLRSVAVHAARGQVRSQQLFSRLLSDAEQARAIQLERVFDTSMKYKVGWEQELERRERLGITGPEPILHPDDVQLNFYTGEVTFTAPLTRKEKAEWDLLWDRVEEADQKIELRTNQLKKIRSKMVRNHVEAEIAAEQSIRDAIVSKIGEPRKRRRS